MAGRSVGELRVNRILECVPNFSEGRDHEVVSKIVAAIASVPGVRVLDESMDMDHNRAVVTFVGAPEPVVEAAYRGTQAAAGLINMVRHKGAHPRVGATDVVPFVPLTGTTMQDCIAAARAFGERVGRTLDIPVYLYGEAATRPERRDLALVRKGEYEALVAEIGKLPERDPDFGPRQMNLEAGATCAGARMPLIAFNVYLSAVDAKVAKKIARTIRESSGGMPCVKAIGMEIPQRRLSQVSMNLTNYKVTSVKTVFDRICALAIADQVTVVESELIGLMPKDALSGVSPEQLLLSHFDGTQLLENRIADLMGGV